jgi:hypothetical protein
MVKIIPPSGDSTKFTKDIFGEFEWPEEVLKRAREAVIRDGYAVGVEKDIRAGKFDHWNVIKVACHAICDSPTPIVPKVAPQALEPIPRELTFEDKMELRALELERSMQEKYDKLSSRYQGRADDK